MPQALFYGGMALAGIFGFGWAASKTGDALDAVGETEGALEESANLARWIVLGGGLYVGYKVAKTSGLIK